MSDLALVSDKNKSFFIVDRSVIEKKRNEWESIFGSIKPLIDYGCSSQESLLDMMKKQGCLFCYQEKLYLDQVVSSIDTSELEVADFSSNLCEEYVDSLKGSCVTHVVIDSIDDLTAYHEMHSELKHILRVSGTGDVLDPGCLLEEVEGILKEAKALDSPIDSLCITISKEDDIIKILTEFSALLESLGCANYNLHTIYVMGEGVYHNIKGAASSCIPLLKNLQMAATVTVEASRFFVESAYTIYTHIIGKKVKMIRDVCRMMYYTDNGVYCSFYNAHTHGEALNPQPICIHHPSQEQQEKTFVTTIFGPTCDSIDTLGNSFQLPELEVGDWLKYENNGYKCSSYSTRFNGFEDPDVIVI